MLSTDFLFDYTLFGIIGLYLVVVARVFYFANDLPSKGWIGIAVLCWPLFMLDEWVRLWDLQMLIPVFGLSDAFGVLLLTCCYRAVKSLLVLTPSRRFRLWWPFAVTAVIQSFVVFIPESEKLLWLEASPSGSPLLLWPVYLSSLCAGFSILLLGIFITEHVHLYHRHLPEQVVDVQEFRVAKLAGVMAFTVGVAFFSILLVTAAMFGFFELPVWESLHHVILGLPLLLCLLLLSFKRTTSPSPLDYERLEHLDIKPAQMREVITLAEQAMIDQKAYKEIGLTLASFCRKANIDPTTLAMALQFQVKKNFRSFVYHYRLEYAKKVLLRTDTKIAKVAKRLGLNSEKFLSDVLVKHLRNNPSL